MTWTTVAARAATDPRARHHLGTPGAQTAAVTDQRVLPCRLPAALLITGILATNHDRYH